MIRIETSGAPDLVRFLTGTDGSFWLQPQRSVSTRSITRGAVVALNLATPEAQEIARKIIRQCDFVTENFTVGNMAKYGSRLRRSGQDQTRPHHAERHAAWAGRTVRADGGIRADDAGVRGALPYHGLSRFVSVRNRRHVAGLRGWHGDGVFPARRAALSRPHRRGAISRFVDGRDGHDDDAGSDDGFS